MPEQQEDIWVKTLKFLLNYNLEHIFYKMMYQFYLMRDNRPKMYKGNSNTCSKYKCKQETFFHFGGQTKEILV